MASNNCTRATAITQMLRSDPRQTAAAGQGERIGKSFNDPSAMGLSPREAEALNGLLHRMIRALGNSS